MTCKCGCTEFKYMGNWPNMQYGRVVNGELVSDPKLRRHDGYKCEKCKAIVKIPGNVNGL